MTLAEVYTEMKTCEAKVKQLQEEVLAEKDKNVAKAKLDEMIIVARRAYVLNTTLNAAIFAKLKVENKKLVNKIKEARQKVQ